MAKASTAKRFQMGPIASNPAKDQSVHHRTQNVMMGSVKVLIMVRSCTCVPDFGVAHVMPPLPPRKKRFLI